MTDPADPFGRLGRSEADALRSAVGNAMLEGWTPSPLDIARLTEVAAGETTAEAYIEAAVERALNAAHELGAPDCIDVPASFPDTMYPGTQILRNRFGIRDPDALRQLEFETGTVRCYLIDQGVFPIPETFDGAHLVAIHRAIMGVVYPWAGAFRRYDMAMRQTAFHSVWIERYLADASRLLHQAVAIRPPNMLSRRLPHLPGRRRQPSTRVEWIPVAAEIYAYLNCAHPFREGNGRSSKTLLQLASRRLGFGLDFSRVSKQVWDNASARSAPDWGHYRPDSHMLRPVFTSIVTEPTSTGQIEPSELRGH
jgi:cell filamentation protein